MMTTPQPNPQQPIYPDQLRFELDRQYTRITDYVDNRVEKALNQLRVDRHEAVLRDEVLLKRIENIEATQKVIIDVQRELVTAFQAMQGTIQTMQGNIQTLQQNMVTMQQNMVTMQQTMQTMQQTMQTMQQQITDGFAAQAERHNELMMRVERLERHNNPPAA